MRIGNLQATSTSQWVAGVRLMLGLIFVMTGAMKLLVPRLGEAWSGQLLAAGLPFYHLTKSSVPFVEIMLGVVLLVGFYTRVAAHIVVGMMLVATYVHVVVDDPALFPLQPSEPIIPLFVIFLAAVLILKGGGSWSRDLRADRSRHSPSS